MSKNNGRGAFAYLLIPACVILCLLGTARIAAPEYLPSILIKFGAFPPFLLAIAAYYTWRSQCPSCGRYFAAQMKGKRFTEKGNFEVMTYECRHCRHTWTRKDRAD